jgi:hypothetical protein
MIASAAIITAMMMTIPMLMAAIIRPPRHHKRPTRLCETLTKELGWSCSRHASATCRETHLREPLIDCKEDRTPQAVLVGMLREG